VFSFIVPPFVERFVFLSVRASVYRESVIGLFRLIRRACKVYLLPFTALSVFLLEWSEFCFD